MNQFGTYLYRAYNLFIFYPYYFVVNNLVCLLYHFLFPITRLRRGHWLGKIWGRAYTLGAGIKVKVTGIENLDPMQSYVFVGNHSSAVDIYAVHGYVDRNIKWVLKKELLKVPLLGTANLLIGNVPVDRKNSIQAMNALNKAKKRIKNGISIIFFPEGTRSRTGKLLPFKRGAFLFAIETQLPIVPMTIKNANIVAPADSIFMKPGTVEIVIHKPIQVAGYDKTTVMRLAGEARGIIGRELGQL